MTNSYQPYTYLIGWATQHKFYYGVRYAKNCSPTDLWSKYFTSSKEVAAMKTVHGDPDIIQIRKIFLTKEHARLWENKVLRRLKVVSREDFLNKNDAPAPPINNRVMSEITKTKIGTVHKGKPKSEEHKQKIREARAKQVNTRKGQRATEETKQKLREANLGKTYSEDVNSKKGQKKDLHWTYGKPRTEETKQKLREANLGKVLSEETKQKMRGPRLKLKEIK